MNGRSLLVMVAVLLGSIQWVAAADTVVLRGGKSLRGLIVDHRSDELAIKLRTDHGEMPVLRSTVERVELDPDLEARYWLAREYFEETAEGLFDLALWCQVNKLDDERDEHLNAVLEINPNHAESRKLLGYVRRGREWVLQEEAADTNNVQGPKEANLAVEVSRRAQDGREKFEHLRRQQETLRKQQELNKTVVRLVSWLDSKNADQVQQARAELAEIRDPLAIGPLTKAMGKTAAVDRLVLLDAIGRIPAPEATYAVAIASVVDQSSTVRTRALDLLKDRSDQEDRYLPLIEQALRSEKVGLIYNGAEALTELGKKRSMPLLIGSLMTPTRTVYRTEGFVTTYTEWVPGIKLVDVWPGGTFIPLSCPG
ncbi:MAG: hypothetical protein HY000_38135 [Planctomycetes bacterium]|nr:hypothetical protein [Planctomycetota bacterium]